MKPTAKTRARLAAARALLDTPPPNPVPGQTAVEVEEPPPLTCDTGNPVCGAPARPYPAGPRCDRHRPYTYRPE
ncbi:aromatic ring-opening dioxygenase LigA [Streptomyces sp. SID8111]|uniref:aromatic ring-opening dioxygenase LigA n=1 Tax=Streptomyces sp. SID8111 TaxID=2706100 RepID=UPI0013C16C51|nr:aromatic ring-opening dioxygenase LigA [Streptomyces sp. SID8111]NEC29558.1 aromatic ring-opening dioxygenase LigA [Streptomyces sp. SID8111]